MTTCPSCQSTETTTRPPAQPWWAERARASGPRLMKGAAALVVLCALMSLLFGLGPTPASSGVVGALLVLVAVDVWLRARGLRGLETRQCQRCGHVWAVRAPASFGLRLARLATTITLPWNVAAFLFAPRHRLAPEDRLVGALSRVRVVLGFAIVLGVALWYRSYGQLQAKAFLSSWALTALLAIPSVLICGGLLVAYTRPAQRAATVRQLRWPLLSLAGFVGTVGIFTLFVEFADDLNGYLDGRGERLPLDGVAYGGVFGIWLLVFSFRAAYLVGKNWFNAADGHLLLPPIIATWMAWLVAVVSLIGDAGGPPRPVSLVLILGGAAATTALAGWEAVRAIRQYGVTLRDGPWPKSYRQAS